MRRLLVIVLALIAFLIGVRIRSHHMVGAAEKVTHITVAGRDVAIWKPAGPTPAYGYPVVLFRTDLAAATRSLFF